MLFKTCIKAYKAETSILKKDKTKHAHRWILKKIYWYANFEKPRCNYYDKVMIKLNMAIDEFQIWILKPKPQGPLFDYQSR